MKLAQKMVLIPEAEYLSLLKKPHKHMDSKSNQLKKQMKEVLKGKRDHTAATNMSQLVGAYIRHKESEKPPPPKPKADEFLEFFNPIYHKKVASLISQLHEHGIRWNEQKELMLTTGETIEHSNIVDLIQEALVGRKKKKQRESTPIGWEAFIQAIASSTIPKSFFTKQSTLQDINKEQHGWEVY